MTECSPCEKEEYSLNDGSGCVTCADTTECPCLAGDAGPCFSSKMCLNYGGGSHVCDGCPVGYEGDGVSCTDIDEVSESAHVRLSKFSSGTNKEGI